MSSLAISGIALVSIFGSAIIGMLLRAKLPEHHLNTDTKDVVKLATGIIGTMTGMVLGLLVGSAKSTFDAQRDGISQVATNIIMTDRALAHYGPETTELRARLRDVVDEMLQSAWPEQDSQSGKAGPKSDTLGRHGDIFDQLLGLAPKNDGQRTLQAQALKCATDFGQTRWLLFAARGGSIPVIFLSVMISWLGVTFASFGLFSPRNATATVALFIGALVVSSSVFLILELDHPFSGIIQISSQPLRIALTQLGH